MGGCRGVGWDAVEEQLGDPVRSRWGARCGETIVGLGGRLGGGEVLEAMSFSTWLLSSLSSTLIVLNTFVCRLNVAVRLSDHHQSSWSRM